jgi:hypothetical protein
MIFMFDAGMKSFPAFREYSVSPLAGSTIRIPQCAFANLGSITALSIDARSAARSSGRTATAAGVVTIGAATATGATRGVQAMKTAAGITARAERIR